MRFASGFLAAIVLMILVALAVPYSGVVNVAATARAKNRGSVPPGERQ